MAKVAYRDMVCKDLLELAPTKPRAYKALYIRACGWDTCAVGDVARALNTDIDQVLRMDFEGKLDTLGVRFMDEIHAKEFGVAKKTMAQIKNRVKKVLKTVVDNA